MKFLLIAAGIIGGLFLNSDCIGQCTDQRALPRPAPSISIEERQALIAFYEATDGSHWKKHDGWLGPADSECDWYGVTCGDRLESGSTPVVGLSLQENNLTGSIPEAVSRFVHLEWFEIYGNKISGKFPEALIHRWQAGDLWIAAESPHFTDVSELDFEASASALLCMRHRVVFRSDGKAEMFTEKCRNATPGDRTTFCETKKGSVGWSEFAKLGSLFDKNDFFRLHPDYRRNVTDGEFESTRVIRNSKIYEVVNYADAGPLELWTIQRAIDGVADSIEWEKPLKQDKCPKWSDGPLNSLPNK